ncbi:MAG: hypothetical protein HQK55_16905, partial [Deltaproteobacteria bacterium]|nr:hypothetical protein [Deltaproteobacteria bacterium]
SDESHFLIYDIGIRAFDLSITWKKDDSEKHSMRMEKKWIPIFCNHLSRLPEEDRQWWEQFVKPAFPADLSILIPGEILKAHFHGLISIFQSRIEADEELRQNTQALKTFIDSVGGPFLLESFSARQRRIEGLYSTMSWDENGLRITTFPPKGESPDGRAS